jgi:hypothetical protein
MSGGLPDQDRVSVARAGFHQFGCDVAQGYLLAMPIPAADLTSWPATYDRASRTSGAR